MPTENFSVFQGFMPVTKRGIAELITSATP